MTVDDCTHLVCPQNKHAQPHNTSTSHAKDMYTVCTLTLTRIHFVLSLNKDQACTNLKFFKRRHEI
jgi:hypothetical protein